MTSTAGNAVQPPRELGGVDARTRKEVDLPGAIRGGHDDLALEIRELLLQARACSTGVWP